LVRQELYDEAIAAYESYLRRNPDVDSADKVAAKIAEIRKFQGLIETARVATGENNLAVARQSYAEALQLNPASNIAKTGLAEAERKLAVPH
jgi:tetratricopeptide (TPR) repeat protein